MQYRQYLKRTATAGSAPAAKRPSARATKPVAGDKPSRRGLRRSTRT
jgi:hypothetical protein